MDQQDSGVADPKRDADRERRNAVTNRDACARPANGEPVRPGARASLDFARKAMLGLAALLTLAWLAVLIWGGARLIMAMFF
jgi:hypothetical protein